MTIERHETNKIASLNLDDAWKRRRNESVPDWYSSLGSRVVRREDITPEKSTISAYAPEITTNAADALA